MENSLRKERRPVLAFMSRLMFTALLLLTTTVAFAQGKTVTGVVLDETGEPITGANVVVVGTTSGIITDIDGNFKLSNVADNATIKVSYIGYLTQEVSAAGKTHLQVQLAEDTQTLDEVVVIGYGTVRKSDVTGAVTSVNEKTIKEKPVQNAVQALQGKAAGVDITSNMRPGEIGDIRIRGNRSIEASNDPLYVIDGIPMISGSISDINPNDIASIEILKDASATAIYGSRGANGVILVSLKNGTKGRVSINYDASFTFTNIHPLTEYMNSGELLDWRRQSYLNGETYSGAYGTAPDPARDYTLFMGSLEYMKRILGTAYQLTDNDPSKPVLRPATAEEKARGYADQVPVYNASQLYDQNWTDEVLRTGVTQNHQVSLSAGSDNSNIYMSIGYLNQKSPMVDQDYDRYTVNIRGEITPKKWLKVGISTNASYSLQNLGMQNGTSNSGANDSYGQAVSLMPYAPAYDEEGKLFKPQASDVLSYHNVVNNIQQANYENRQYSVMANTFGEVTFMPWLKYRVNFGSQYRNRRTGYYYGPNFSNPFGSNPAASVPGTGYYNQPSYFSWVVENLLYADKTIGNHNFGATILQSAQQRHDESINIRNQELSFPSALWYSLNQSSRSAPYGFGTDMTESQLLSYMIRLNYSFKSRYLLTITGRWDGASVLAPGHKWDFFPSTAIAWKMEEEDFLKDIRAISQLKIRVGYGVTGNSAVSAYSTSGSVRKDSYYFDKTLALGYKANVMPNPNLGWEKTAQWNVGLDFGILKNRISGTIEVYKAKTSDLLLNRSLPPVSGYVQVRDNIGKTENNGIEITVSAVNMQQKNFSWTTDLNWSMNKEKIVDVGLMGQDDLTNGWFIGHPIRVWYDYEFDRLWQDTPEDKRLLDIYKTISNYTSQPGQAKFKDQPFIQDNSKKGADGYKTITVNGEEITYLDNGFGTASTSTNTDRRILGSSRPDWVAGMTNTFTYKNWTLNFFVYARVGNMYYGALQTYERRVENSVWSPENPNGRFYQPTTKTGLTDHNYLQNYCNGSMVTVRNIALSYTLPEKWTKKLDLSRNVQVYGQVLNPFLWGGDAVKLGINPDDVNDWRSSNIGSGSAAGGGSSNNTILMRSWVLGVRIGF